MNVQGTCHFKIDITPQEGFQALEKRLIQGINSKLHRSHDSYFVRNVDELDKRLFGYDDYGHHRGGTEETEITAESCENGCLYGTHTPAGPFIAQAIAVVEALAAIKANLEKML